MTALGEPVNEAQVEYAMKKGPSEWNALDEHYQTGSDGTFQECAEGFAPGNVLRIRVRRQGTAETDTILTIASKLTIVRVQIPDSR